MLNKFPLVILENSQYKNIHNITTILFIALKCFRDKHIYTPGLQKKLVSIFWPVMDLLRKLLTYN